VLVLRYNESVEKTKSVRMLADLTDQSDGSVPVRMAKDILMSDAGGDRDRTAAALAMLEVPGDVTAAAAKVLRQARAKRSRYHRFRPAYSSAPR
jgi:hypothetical protein